MKNSLSDSLFLFTYRVLYLAALICYLPLLLYRIWNKGAFSSFAPRIFPNAIPKIEEGRGGYCIWVHAVSLGETIAVQPLVEKLLEREPNTKFIFSHITEAGMDASKNLFPFAHSHLYLPFELKSSYKKLLKNIAKIDLLIYCEGDIWPLFTRIVKEKRAFIGVVNSKLSEKSLSRYKIVPAIARSLFSDIDLFCLQNEEYKERYLSLGISADKLSVTGNIKGDRTIHPIMPVDQEKILKQIGCSKNDRILIAASTHDPEEVEIASVLAQKGLIGTYRLIIVPRHKHRFTEALDAIQSRIPECKLALLSQYSGGSWDILIVDKMGYLSSLYQIAYAAIVCGSFIQSIGGHNILEPALVGCPFIIGPYIHSQIALYESALVHDAVLQVESINALSSILENFLNNPQLRNDRSILTLNWANSMSGATERTLDLLKKMITNSF
ncbi:MAG: glycosyltransferase N-terminal domain-containing protein [Chlamydia sp.]